jgi:hexosaminidase
MGPVKGALASVAVLVVAVAAILIWKAGMDDEPTEVRRHTGIRDVVPVPVSVTASDESFTVTEQTAIVADPAVGDVALRLGEILRARTGFALPVRDVDEAGSIRLRLAEPRDEALADEGYELVAGSSGVTIRANAPAGLFYGVQTFRQLVPATGDATVPGGTVVDRPRYAYRGVMLDVARHFFPVADVQRLIDLAAMHKVNHLHLHLTDDQGWRIAVDSWPRLANHGGGTEVGGGPGGFYTKDDYRAIVAHARRNFVTVVPEVDLPGHTNAALASYPELDCDGQAPQRYTGIGVGFSSLCVDKDVTYRFLDDVFRELAELTPGPYLHIGGDEATTLTPDAYATIVGRAQEIVAGHGKTVIGWHEIAGAKLLPSTVVQYWGVTREAPEVAAACAQGTRVILSPANHTYLDMKYDADSPLGLSWAGYVNVETAYDWDPSTHIHGVDPACVAGVESPLWTETVRTVDEIEFMAMPRLAAVAELGWSPAESHDWAAFRERLGAQAERWRALGIDFYPAPEIPWVRTP